MGRDEAKTLTKSDRQTTNERRRAVCRGRQRQRPSAVAGCPSRAKPAAAEDSRSPAWTQRRAPLDACLDVSVRTTGEDAGDSGTGKIRRSAGQLDDVGDGEDDDREGLT